MTPLARMRSKLAISRRKVSADTQIEYSHLYRIERGEATASPAVAKKLADYFDNEVTRDEILYPELHPEPTAKKPVHRAVTKKPARSVQLQEA